MIKPNSNKGLLAYSKPNEPLPKRHLKVGRKGADALPPKKVTV
jgi:hypothetical protein